MSEWRKTKNGEWINFSIFNYIFIEQIEDKFFVCAEEKRDSEGVQIKWVLEDFDGRIDAENYIDRLMTKKVCLKRFAKIAKVG